MNRTSMIWVLFPIGAVLGVIVAAAIFLEGAPEETGNRPRKVRRNVVVLLDLSDRIDPRKAPDQAARDQEIIRHVVGAFDRLVKQKLYVGSEDVLHVDVAQQPTSYTSEMSTLAKNLRIDLSRVGAAHRRSELPVLEDSLLAGVDQLYQAASANRLFPGADIWSYVNEDLSCNASLRGADSVRTVLIVLTDGYIEFDREVTSHRPREGRRTSFMETWRFEGRDDWQDQFSRGGYGLIPARTSLGGIKVLVLEVNSRRPLDPREFEIIKNYWTDWLWKSGVRREDVAVYKRILSESLLEQVLDRYILGL
jgi:hypothetical protein